MEHTLLLNIPSTEVADSSTSQLRQEYQAYQNLFQVQSGLVQQYLNLQAASVAEAILKDASRIRFMLPDTVVCMPSQDDSLKEAYVPSENRTQLIGSRISPLSHPDMRVILSQHLSELERSSNQAVAASAGLLRHAIATYLVYSMLPAGKSVVYKRLDGDEIPTEPVESGSERNSAINSGMDISSTASSDEMERGELSVPYAEAARHFYLPQWVAFDNQGHLLVNNLSEAEAHIASMQRYLFILYTATVVAPYMIADETWQQKRYGMLGQLVNQGRAYGYHQTQEIIQIIQRRLAVDGLNRGLSLSLPYFNDHTLLVEEYNFDVIPFGRVMFVPAFVVLAVRAQAVKVAQEPNLSQTTRKHLLMELSILEKTFLR